MAKLTLYYMPSCPYCQKVLRFMKDNDLQLPMKDIRAEEENRAELVKIGGKGQVPCLVIDGKPMYESGDIIEWMGEHLVNR